MSILLMSVSIPLVGNQKCLLSIESPHDILMNSDDNGSEDKKSKKSISLDLSHC